MLILFVGVGLVLALAAGLPFIFKRLGLTKSDNALGLPDGSIRALIALILMALFATAPLYLFNELGGRTVALTGIDPAEKSSLEARYKDNATFLKEAGTPEKMTVIIRSTPDAATVDFAKQMMVLLGTLATAVTSFFFGANTANAASKQGSEQSGLVSRTKPSLGAAKTDPALLTRTENNSIAFQLRITGNGLNGVKAIRISAGTESFTFPAVSSETEARCDVSCTPKNPAPADWDLTVIDRMDQASDPLLHALKF